MFRNFRTIKKPPTTMPAIGLYSHSEEAREMGMKPTTRWKLLNQLNDLVDRWEPASMAWPLKWGMPVAMLSAGVSGPILVNRFRYKKSR